MKRDPKYNNYRFFILYTLILTVCILFIGRLSGFGFMVSEYLSASPRINYICAIILVFVGFVNCYRYFKDETDFNTNRALRIYVSVGIAMSGIYYLVHISHVGCYKFPDDISNTPSILDFIYFSFITVSTVGYGDIVPQHTFVRVLVLFQVLFALYLILRVSRRP